MSIHKCRSQALFGVARIMTQQLVGFGINPGKVVPHTCWWDHFLCTGGILCMCGPFSSPPISGRKRIWGEGVSQILTLSYLISMERMMDTKYRLQSPAESWTTHLFSSRWKPPTNHTQLHQSCGGRKNRCEGDNWWKVGDHVLTRWPTQWIICQQLKDSSKTNIWQLWKQLRNFI